MPLTVLNTKQQFTKPNLFQRFERGPVADKFFLVAASIAIFGILVLGIQIWLMREGVMIIKSDYLDLRSKHMTLMLFGFFGTVIAGFTIQAGPQMFQAQSGISGLLRLCALVAPIFALLCVVLISEAIGRQLFAVPLIVSLLSLFSYRDRLIRSAGTSIFIVGGHIVLIAGAISGYCYLPLHAFGMIVVGVLGTILGAQQLFLSNLFGGRRCTSLQGSLLFCLLVCTTATAILAERMALSAVGLILFYMLYIYMTEAWRLIAACFKTPLAFAICSSFAWSIIAAVLLIIDPSAIDRANHILATGAGVTTVMAVTLHIVQFMAGEPNSKRGWAYLMLVLWQMAPVSRGLYAAGAAPKGLVLSGTGAMIVGLSLWLILFLASEKKVLRRQITLRGKEEMPKV